MQTLIRVLEATVNSPQHDSQRPTNNRSPTAKELRRQRATTPIFHPERACRRKIMD